MHAISSYRGNRPTNTHTPSHTQTDRTDYYTLCSVIIVAFIFLCTKYLLINAFRSNYGLPLNLSNDPSVTPHLNVKQFTPRIKTCPYL